MGAFICYESAFPHVVRQFAKRGADLLVNLSNDGYFGHSAAREQHLEIVRMRAAENRRWMLRATNDGITAAIDPAGRVDAAAADVSGSGGAHELRLFAAAPRSTPSTATGSRGAVWLAAAWRCSGRSVRTTTRSGKRLPVPDHQHIAILDDVLFAFQPQQALSRERRDSRRDRSAPASSPLRRG